jgi:uncharacterized membrane protein (DUF2068 family)
VSGAKGHTAEDRALWLIGGFKLIKGLLLLVVALGALNLVHKDIEDVTATWAARLHLDVGNRYVDAVLGKLLSLDDRKLKEISAGTFFYAALLLTEGVGLLLRKRWAEYFTVIVTGSFIPLELYELARHVTATRVALLGINVAVVWYLVVVLRRHKGERG